MTKTLISFVIPCYRSEKTIVRVIDEIIRTVALGAGYDYEIIAVNDCSPDRVHEILAGIAKANEKVKVVNFAKNMGKHAAVLAGYSFAKGEYVVDLDDDMQSPVYELWRLLEPLIDDSCDYVTAKYSRKRQAFLKNVGSDFNLAISTIMLEKQAGLRFENFSAMKRFVCREMVKYRNPYPYLEGLVLRVTRRIATVEMDQREREDDCKTGFTFRKSASLLLNGLTAFSVKPLRVASLLGVAFALCGFMLGFITVTNKLIDPSVPAGYSSLMAVVLFSSGTLMLLLGVIGEYIGRIYICLNDSPQYVIRETINIED